MKRILIIVAAATLLLVGAVAAVFVVTFSGRQAITDGFELNGVQVVKDGFVSACIVDVGEGGAALVDAGNDPAGKAILAALAKRNLSPDAVKAVLLTHGHRDHIAATPLFRNAERLALANERDIVAGRAGSHGPIQHFMPVKPTGIEVTRGLHDGETFTVGRATFRVFAVPGHTDGSAAYLVNGVLIMGDSADADSHGRVVTAPWLFSNSVAQDRASLVRLQKTLAAEQADVKAIVFAHSGVLTQGLAPLTAFANQH